MKQDEDVKPRLWSRGKAQQRSCPVTVDVQFKLEFDHEQTLQLLNTQDKLTFELPLALTLLIFMLLLAYANIGAIANPCSGCWSRQNSSLVAMVITTYDC